MLAYKYENQVFFPFILTMWNVKLNKGFHSYSCLFNFLSTIWNVNSL